MTNNEDEEVFEPGDSGANGNWDNGGRGAGRRKPWSGSRSGGGRGFNSPRGNRGGYGSKWSDGDGRGAAHKQRFGKNVRERGGFVPGPGMTYLSNVEMTCETMVELAAIAKQDDISVFQAARNAIEEYIKERKAADGNCPAQTVPPTPADGDVQY